MDQLGKIFNILGTPSESEWPSTSSVAREAFPSRTSRGVDSFLPEMDDHGKDLLKVNYSGGGNKNMYCVLAMVSDANNKL